MAAHFRSQILATDAFGPLGSCSDVCDEISSTADFDLPSRDRNDLEALDARARQTANIATLHSSVTRKSAWDSIFACVSNIFYSLALVGFERRKKRINGDRQLWIEFQFLRCGFFGTFFFLSLEWIFFSLCMDSYGC